MEAAISGVEIVSFLDDDALPSAFVMHEVGRLLRKRFEQAALNSGLTLSQWQVLAYLKRYPGIKQSSLAELLDIEPISLCRSIDRLQGSKMVERCPDPSDRRVWLLQLTPLARLRLAELEEFAACIRNEAFVGIPRNEQQRLSETFKLIKANLAAACDAAVGKQKKLRSAA